MTVWQNWLEHPQQLWLRKAFFQVHLWVGIGAGLYVLAVSISGSAIVFRRQIAGRYSRQAVVIAETYRPRIGPDGLRQLARRLYPQYEEYGIYESTRPDRADEIVLGRGKKRIARLFNPYTGADLGDPQSKVDRGLEWLVNLHDNLLSGQTGRVVNGAGALLVTLLCLTGTIIWWPGIKNWRRSVSVNWKTHFARLNWDLHSAIGFWCFLFVLLWGVSGVCLCFPGSLSSIFSRHFLSWITQLHFGRFNGLTEALWTVLGLAPAALFVTGALMWWNRVLRKKLRHLQ